MNRRFSLIGALSLMSAAMLGPAVSAQVQSPYSHDRVYTSDQTSNTVSVIDPANNTLLGVIKLGDAGPSILAPLYKGALLVHGMGFSPDHRLLDVISIGSNSVTLIDTQTNSVKGTVYVGRAPHEAFFTPDGNQLWVAVRGENYVSVIDPKAMREVRRITVANGPGMIMFRPDGKYAFICSSFTPELDVVDTKTDKVIARLPQVSPFSPNIAVSPDGQQVWITLKDTGKTQVYSARRPFRTLAVINTGPITNHVNMVDNANGHFAYVTVGGENEVKVLSRTAPFPLIATIPTGPLPHGIWPSGDGNRVYVGLENGDAVSAIDTLTNKVIATIPCGEAPQALVYVPDAVSQGDGIANLSSLGSLGNAVKLTLFPPAGTSSVARASVAVNSLGLIDNVEAAVIGLTPGAKYGLYLATSDEAPYGTLTPLVYFNANASGSAITQALGPLRDVLTHTSDTPEASRFLVIAPVAEGMPGTPVLVQSTGEAR